jgi:hypothetical protein
VVGGRWGKKGRTWVSGVSEGGWGLGEANSQFGQDVGCSEAKKQKDSLKTKERSGNVYENKWPGFHSPVQTGNVIENKDTYELKAGMLLKIRVVGRW